MWKKAGVLWSGDHIFDGTVETIEFLKSKGILEHCRPIGPYATFSTFQSVTLVSKVNKSSMSQTIAPNRVWFTKGKWSH